MKKKIAIVALSLAMLAVPFVAPKVTTSLADGSVVHGSWWDDLFGKKSPEKDLNKHCYRMCYIPDMKRFPKNRCNASLVDHSHSKDDNFIYDHCYYNKGKKDHMVRVKNNAGDVKESAWVKCGKKASATVYCNPSTSSSKIIAHTKVKDFKTDKITTDNWRFNGRPA